MSDNTPKEPVQVVALRNLTNLDGESDRLNDRQHLAIEMMLAGATLTAIAAKVGVSRQSVSTWRNQDPDFIAELKRRRLAQYSGIGDKLRALLDPAVDVLAEQLNDRYDQTRFRAATTLLRLANVKSVVAVEES